MRKEPRSSRGLHAPRGPSSDRWVAVDANGADLGPAEVAAGAALAAERGVGTILFGPAAELGEVPAGVQVVERAGLDRQAPGPGSRGGGTTPRGPRSCRPRAAVAEGTRAGARVRGRHRLPRSPRARFNNQARLRHLPAPRLALPVAGARLARDAARRRSQRRGAAASTSCSSPSWGAALARTVLQIPRPRVALLSNGEEAGRGSPLVLEAHAELRPASRRPPPDAFEFVGNVEGDDVVAGIADVIVSDGFTRQTSRLKADGGGLAE